jgi:hypothetical protein
MWTRRQESVWEGRNLDEKVEIWMRMQEFWWEGRNFDENVGLSESEDRNPDETEGIRMRRLGSLDVDVNM